MINISTNRHVKHMIKWLTPGCYTEAPWREHTPAALERSPSLAAPGWCWPRRHRRLASRDEGISDAGPQADYFLYLHGRRFRRRRRCQDWSCGSPANEDVEPRGRHCLPYEGSVSEHCCYFRQGTTPSRRQIMVALYSLPPPPHPSSLLPLFCVLLGSFVVRLIGCLQLLKLHTIFQCLVR